MKMYKCCFLALKTLRGEKWEAMKFRNWCQKERLLHHWNIIFIAWCIHIPTKIWEGWTKNAGLGDKDTVLDIDASQDKFQRHILHLFPLLKDAGGYKFLKGNVIYSYYFPPETWNPCLFICLAALECGWRELCNLVIIMSVCLSVIMGIHFQAFKLKHCMLYSH